MYVVMLRFAANRHSAGEHLPAHNEWIRSGFDDGVFLLTGSMGSGDGGIILAVESSTDRLVNRLAQDPFVAHGVVAIELIRIEPNLVDDRLAFLASMGGTA
jgi:uncharacterized protein YciI